MSPPEDRDICKLMELVRYEVSKLVNELAAKTKELEMARVELTTRVHCTTTERAFLDQCLEWGLSHHVGEAQDALGLVIDERDQRAKAQKQ